MILKAAKGGHHEEAHNGTEGLDFPWTVHGPVRVHPAPGGVTLNGPDPGTPGSGPTCIQPPTGNQRKNMRQMIWTKMAVSASAANPTMA